MDDGLNPRLVRFGGVMQKDTVQEFHFFCKQFFLQGHGRTLATIMKGRGPPGTFFTIDAQLLLCYMVKEEPTVLQAKKVRLAGCGQLHPHRCAVTITLHPRTNLLSKKSQALQGDDGLTECKKHTFVASSSGECPLFQILSYAMQILKRESFQTDSEIAAGCLFISRVQRPNFEGGDKVVQEQKIIVFSYYSPAKKKKRKYVE